jgi:hypothetical protein
MKGLKCGITLNYLKCYTNHLKIIKIIKRPFVTSYVVFVPPLDRACISPMVVVRLLVFTFTSLSIPYRIGDWYLKVRNTLTF